MKLSKMLKLYRASEGLEQKELAEEIGLIPSTLSRLENGKSVSLEGFAKLITWLCKE